MSEICITCISILAALIALYLFKINYQRHDGWGRMLLLIFTSSLFAYYLMRACFYSGGFIFGVISRSTAMKLTQLTSHVPMIPLIAVAVMEIIMRRRK